MFTHPELTMALAREHQRELIAEGEKNHLLALARRHRYDAKRGGPVRNAAARGRPGRLLAAH